MGAETISARILPDQIKKGMRLMLRSGWEAVVVKPPEDNTLIAKVYGQFTETGSIYLQDIESVMVDGEWVEVEFTGEQAQFHDMLQQLHFR
ncbi:MAG: hypothetical protein AB7T17_01445 [Geobacter sp.]